MDRTGADLALRTASGSRPEGTVEGRDTASSDWSERHFQLSVENTWEENARSVASAIEEAVSRTGAALVVLVGDERERRTVHEKLPGALPAAVVETGHGGRAAGSDSARLAEWIAERRREQARLRAEEALERFTAAKGRDGTTEAADGVAALINAAREHRIATLLLRPDGPDTHREVWAGPQAEQIALRRTDARALDEPEPFPVRADDALLRSAALTGADVVVVGAGATRDRSFADDLAADNRPETGPDGAEPVGGLGAVLRWPTGGDHPLVESGT
ncbi:Vms1/Ankzf1 family peptidyl-tRNA hydrolase [Streptomyces griseus]|uniref:Vms1/Ankzf1 family peptidyl-tRNA hydrolase n=2 Tax=Streptomyces TaxID=1883 RepID=A0ABU2VY06_9ACTN|nr:Vms1/Ankzf1 family peptidyl-tRNA hydrolase [Streptomyces griseus]MDT0490168.1 Vms1/Ankzf1 family peptidyl-tRNA hydrolase [Streptomyces griseus]